MDGSISTDAISTGHPRDLRKRLSRVLSFALWALLIAGGILIGLLGGLGLRGQILAYGALVGICGLVFATQARFLHSFLVFSIVLSSCTRFDIQFFRHLHRGGAPSLTVSITDLLVIIALLVLVLNVSVVGRRQRFDLRTPFTMPMLSIFTVGLLSFAVAQAPVFVAFELFAMARAFLVFVVLSWLLTKESRLRAAFAAIACAFVLQALVAALEARGMTGILFTLVGAPDPTDPGAYLMQSIGGVTHLRPGGTLGHPNHLARYIILFLPMCFSVLTSRVGGCTKLVALCASLCGLVALALTLSRSGWLGLVAGCVVLTIWIVRKGEFRQVTRWIAGLVVLGAVTAILTPFLIMPRLMAYDENAAKSRIPLMQVAFAMFLEHPLLGVGLNNYGEEMESYADSADGLTRDTVLPAHNTLLLTLAELGPVGLLALLWLAFRVVFLGSGVNGQANRLAWMILAGVPAGAVAYFVVVMVNLQYVASDVTFWVLASLGFASFRALSGQTHNQGDSCPEAVR
jgi:O-antigen ligase